MAVESGTATDHDDLFDKLRAFLVAADPTGPAWTELNYNAGARTAIYLAPGLSATEEIHVGFGVVEDTGTDSFALTGWMFRSYNALLGHQSQPGHSGLGYHPVWDTSIPYWFIGNGQRVIVITKISTVYTASYLGKFLPYGVPGEYPQPYYMSMPQAANNRWSSTDESFRNFFDPGDHAGSKMLNPNGTWYEVGNFRQQSGSEASNDSTNYIWPYAANLAVGSTAVTRWRELRQNLDDTVPVYPCVLLGEDPAVDVYGILDGVFACSGFSIASEDTIDIDSVDHLVIQNTYRTDRYYYAAMKLE
jgi:hypothetical protein